MSRPDDDDAAYTFTDSASVREAILRIKPMICAGCSRACKTGWCSDACKQKHSRDVAFFAMHGRWPQ